MDPVIVGANGLVGSAFVRFFQARHLPYRALTRQDMGAVQGLHCELLINCYGNAQKTKANLDPSFDFSASLACVAHYTHTIAAKKTLHISTVDVYPDPGDVATTSEDHAIDASRLHPYGFHKYLAELYVARFSPRALIVRVPALVGPGLRKNPAFDHLAVNKPLWVREDSQLNFLHTDVLVEQAWKLIEADAAGTFNLAASDSMRIADLAQFSGRPCEYRAEAATQHQVYAINVDKARRFVTPQSSASAVARYYEQLLASR